MSSEPVSLLTDSKAGLPFQCPTFPGLPLTFCISCLHNPSQHSIKKKKKRSASSLGYQRPLSLVGTLPSAAGAAAQSGPSSDVPWYVCLAWVPELPRSWPYKQNVPKNKLSTFKSILPYLNCDWTLPQIQSVVVMKTEHLHFIASFSNTSPLNIHTGTQLCLSWTRTLPKISFRALSNMWSQSQSSF